MIDRERLFNGVRPMFGGLSQSQVDGTNALVTAWEGTAFTDLRWLADGLATAKWETAGTMQPIEEYGHGRGHAYGLPTGPWHQVYDGRGDVQLTWLKNYVFATQRLQALGVIGTDIDLAKTPALAMRQDIAAAIMWHGMNEGWFTGKKFSDYFNTTTCDWVDARRIINGLDHAAQIGASASVIFGVLGNLPNTVAST